jgi:hypothetical protein
MSAYVFALRQEDAANWDICKAQRMIGVRTSQSGMTSARLIHPGDAIYVWRGGSGLIARLRATDSARPAFNVPWPDPSSYSFVIPMEVEEELERAVPDSFPGNRKGLRFHIQNTDLQKSLRPLSDESEAALSLCFTAIPTVNADVVPVATESGWSYDQKLIRAVEQAGVSAVRAHLAQRGWREVRDCQRDGCGYDFIFERPDGARHLVEVKGTSGSIIRFNLTGLEHQVLSRDPSSRIFVVVDALNNAVVHELDWTDVEDLGCVAAEWRVGAARPVPANT